MAKYWQSILGFVVVSVHVWASSSRGDFVLAFWAKYNNTVRPNLVCKPEFGTYELCN